MATETLISRWIRPEIRALSAYSVPPASGLIKLDAMENPYDFPKELIDPWLESLKTAEINRYPDPNATALKEQIRRSFSIPNEMDLLLGNGSDEILQILAFALAVPGRVTLAPEPAFVMYRRLAESAQMKYVGVPLKKDFSLDLPEMLAAISKYQPAIIFIAYPNNPTGNLFDADAVRKILAASSGLVVVDEAYHAYASASFLPELGKWPNLVVMRTLSKLGLAGLRLGFLAGSHQWLHEFEKLRLPYNINTLSQVTATLALSKRALLEKQTEIIRSERKRLFEELSRLSGFVAYPSEANFILLRTPVGQAKTIFEKLKSKRILIKCLEGSHPLLADCLRITVGRPEENMAIIDFFRY